MRTKEEILYENITELNGGQSLSFDSCIKAMQEYADQSTTDLLKQVDELRRENYRLNKDNKRLVNCNFELIDKLSQAKERIAELEKNVRQLATLLSKEQIIFMLTLKEKDGIMDILNSLTQPNK